MNITLKKKKTKKEKKDQGSDHLKDNVGGKKKKDKQNLLPRTCDTTVLWLED